MGIRLPRKKKRVFALSLLYRIDRLLPFSTERRLKWYLDLEWIFDRLAMETSFRHFPAEAHPHRLSANAFLLRNLEPRMHVLDLGCGSGDITAVIAAYVDRVVGVDHDRVAVARAAQRHQRANLTFVDRDAMAFLQQEEQRFDTLVLSHVLEHLDGPEEFLQRFKGFFQWIYIEVPDFDKTYLNHYRQLLGSTLIHTDDDHVSEFDREELNAMLQRVGIEVVDAEYRFGVQRLWCRGEWSSGS